jgi:hypothetical protein
MKIKSYHDSDGDISFVVDSEKHQKIIDHLKSKGLNAGGHHTDADDTMREIVVASATIRTVNKALKDFDE